MRVLSQAELQDVLQKHKRWLETRFNKATEGERADLSDADLSRADLSLANLSRADLSLANLSGADLSRANLSGADLSDTDLSGADLRAADLSGADLSRADLSDADLSGADLDFCHIPLSCKGLHWVIDRRLAAQLLYHFCSHNTDDDEVVKIQNSLLAFANEFHRKDECGELKEKTAISAKEAGGGNG